MRFRRLLCLVLLCAVTCCVLFSVSTYAAEVEQYSYNGVVLPALPEAVEHALICVNDDGYYLQGISSSATEYEFSGEYQFCPWVLTDGEWVSRTLTGVYNLTPIWSDVDIYDSDGNLILEASEPVLYVAPSVSVSLDNVGVIYPGMHCQLSALVSGDGIIDSSVTWSVSGADSSATSISSSGLLSIGEDETASILTVSATLTEDTSVFDSLEISVTPRPNPVAEFMTSVGQIFTSATAWISSFAGFIMDHPLVLFAALLGVCGIGIGLIERLRKQRR